MNQRDMEKSLHALAEKFRLNSCQVSVVRLLCQGRTEPAIAKELDLSLNTVKTYVKRLYSKLDVHNRVQFLNAIIDGAPANDS